MGEIEHGKGRGKMTGEKQMSGKKMVTILISIIVSVSLLAVILITVFYNMYDPEKYGRNNGGVDADNLGVPTQLEKSDSLTDE